MEGAGWRADGECGVCRDDAKACGGVNGLEEADVEEARGTRGTRGVSVAFCWNLVRLVE